VLFQLLYTNSYKTEIGETHFNLNKTNQLFSLFSVYEDSGKPQTTFTYFTLVVQLSGFHKRHMCNLNPQRIRFEYHISDYDNMHTVEQASFI